MYPMTILEWFHDGAWKEIGWRAFDPRSALDLRAHAKSLARDGGRYRLTQPNVVSGGPPLIIESWNPAPTSTTQGAARVAPDAAAGEGDDRG